MNVQAVSNHRQNNTRFGFSISPGIATMTGMGYKGSSAAFRVDDFGNNKDLRKAAIKQNSILVGLMGGAQYVLEHLKKPLEVMADKVPAGKVANVVKIAILAGPMLLANVFSEWASRKLSNYNHAMDAALSGKNTAKASKNPFSSKSGGGFWTKRNQTGDIAAFEARLHSAPWTVSPHRQPAGLVPRY